MRSLFQLLLRLVFRHPVPGTSIIPFLEDGRIILVRRQDTKLWALPGGMVKWREDIALTVQRELYEETGLNLVRIRQLVGVYSASDRDPRLHSICFVVAADVNGQINIQDKYEICEVRAFRLEELPEMKELSFDNGQQLQNYLKGLTVVL
ncbi:MAG: NUDIX hydrolase [Hydrococcus sp. RM1_1_31]|nr:NUDIX hydrolase [Hydrococcus sp. RM1_1_31]